MSIAVTDFKWEKGKNDFEYIRLLENSLENQKRLTREALAKIRELAKENKKSEKQYMLVRDLVCNNYFDVNCNYEIHEVNKNTTWHDGNVIFSTIRNGWVKPADAILNMHIKYITTNGDVIVVEACKEDL